MAMGPRMDPFPWETYFIDTRVLTDQQQIDALNSSLNDGVQLNVNLGGYAGTWEHPYTSYDIGLLFPPESDPSYATRVPSIPFGAIWQHAPSQWLPSGLELDPWTQVMGWIGDSSINLYNHPSNVDPILKQRYTSADMRYGMHDGNQGPIPTAGLHTYPGVFGVTGRGSMYAVWCNAPFGIEYWFSENPNRSDPTIGYSGYTAFGDQGNPYFYTNSIEEIADAYVKKLVVGMIRTSADMAAPATTDMMAGVIFTYDGTNTVVDICTNGTVRWTNTYNRSFHPDAINCWFETAWGGDAAVPYDNWTGWMDDFEVYIRKTDAGVYPTEADYNFISSYDNTDASPGGIYVQSYDTYDIKFVMYMDAYSPSYPINQPVPLPSAPTTPVTLYFDSLNMYTNHHWTVPSNYQNTPSPITTTGSYVSAAHAPTNNYTVDSGGINTPNTGITANGEISLTGSVGNIGDVIAHTGANSPAVWDDTLSQYHAQLDALLVRIATAEGAP